MEDAALLQAVSKGASDWMGLCSMIAAFFTRGRDKCLTGHGSRRMYTKNEGGVDVLEKAEDSTNVVREQVLRSPGDG